MKSKIEVSENVQRELNQKAKTYCKWYLAIGIIGLVMYIALSVILETDSVLLDILLFSSALLFAIGLIYPLSIKRTDKRSNEQNAGAIVEYEFFEDCFESTTFKNGEQIGSIKFYYKDVAKVRETKNYLFIYPNYASAFPVDKSTFSIDELSTLKQWLKDAKPKKR